MPAAANAALLIGAVTIAADLARARQADRVLDAGRRGARRPARRRGRAAPRRRSAGRPGAGSTGMQPGGTSATSAGESISATAAWPPAMRAAAPHRLDAADDEAAAHAARRRRTRATISGPMPQTSPIVTAIGRRAVEAMRHCRRLAASIMRGREPACRHAPNLAPLLPDRDRRGRAAVRRRDAQARMARPRPRRAGQRRDRAAAGAGAEPMLDPSAPAPPP